MKLQAKTTGNERSLLNVNPIAMADSSELSNEMSKIKFR